MNHKRHSALPFILLFILTIVLNINGFSQVGKEDVIYLQNGWVLRGEILEMETSGEVKIQTREGNIFIFPMNEVEKIAKEDPFVKAKLQRPFYQKKYISFNNVTEFGLNFGGQNTLPWVRMINGVYFNPYLSVGIGVGFDNMDWSVNFIPVFADVRGEVLKHAPVSPCYYAGIGYGFVSGNIGWWENEKGGLFYNGGIGLKINSRHQASYLLTLGLKRAYMERTIDWGNGTVRLEQEVYLKGTLGAGITF